MWEGAEGPKDMGSVERAADENNDGNGYIILHQLTEVITGSTRLG